MSIKYEILKRVVKAAGLKKMWDGKTAEEIVAAKKKENAKSRNFPIYKITPPPVF